MHRFLILFVSFVLATGLADAQPIPAQGPPPSPLVATGHPADWIFAYKFGATAFPSNLEDPARRCPFGGKLRGERFSQHYVSASADRPHLQEGPGLIGTGDADPLGATFAEVYKGDYYYVVWNDQFQNYPVGNGDAGTGHSKGMLVWNENGDGLVLQVSTPGWPGAGSAKRPRSVEGNTLGCLTKIGNNLIFAQHFFALRLSQPDVVEVLKALVNSKVVTSLQDADNLARIGGPAPIADLARQLSSSSGSEAGTGITDATLSSGVRLISKAPSLQVLPWQLLSAELGRDQPSPPDLRIATWEDRTMHDARGDPRCWGLPIHSGAIEIARDGIWNGKRIKLAQGSSHAKLGVSKSGTRPYVIFSDLNEQGAPAPSGSQHDCSGSQNSRGGMFFILENQPLHDDLWNLMAGGQSARSRGTRSRRR